MFREWSLFTAGGGGKGGDINFECKQLEGGGQHFNAQVQRGSTGLEGGQKRGARISRGARFECERFSEFGISEYLSIKGPTLKDKC